MSETSPALGLPYIQPSQAQKHVTHNEALRILDAVTQLSVLSADLDTPPAAAVTGDRHIVAAPGQGDWAGQDHAIAIYVDTAWHFFAPQTGWRADVGPTGSSLRFDGTGWQVADQPDTLPQLGVNTSADATNRLAVASEATLLTHEGAGHQLKINKNAASDTASLLFQTSFSGRAEMGTTGSDDFAIKVSPDGNTFTEALKVDGSSGFVVIGQGTADEILSVAANATEPTIQVRNLGGLAGAAFRLVDDQSTGDWKFKTKSDGSFKLRNNTQGIDILDISNDPYSTTFAGPVRTASYTVATLPDATAAGAGALVFVTDAAGGSVPAFSDGTAWYRVTDRSIVT